MGLRNWINTVLRPSQEPRHTPTFEPPPHTAPLVVPAQGDVFDLHVIVHLKWSCETFDIDELEKLVLQRRDGALYSIGRTIRDLARSLDPFQPARAQAIINGSEALRKGLCYDEDGHMVTCRPTTQVVMDPRLRDQLLPFAAQRVELHEQHRLGQLHDQQLRERTEEWLQAFQRLEQFPQLGKDERQFLLRYAASLVDKDFAAVIEKMAGDRYVFYSHFAEVLERATRDHERVGLFEFAAAYDKALQTFCRQMGVSPASFLLSDFGEEKPTPERIP
jgi:hypothetical protein